MMTDMKRTSVISFIIISAVSIISSLTAYAQELPAPEGYVYVDSLVYTPVASVDSTLVGKDIFRDMPSRVLGDEGTVAVEQSDLLESSMRKHIEVNPSRTLSGYRVRIFFDNKQSARNESEATLKRFESLYHDVSAYRSYANPYFKVTVGDFRTKSEAMELLERIKNEFPSAFVVKENINFPVVDKNDAFVTDTVKVLRPLAAVQQM